MLTCSEVAAQASTYLDQDMTMTQRAAFRLHLMYCSNCRRFVSQLQLLKQSVQLRPVAAPADAQVERWMQQVLRQSGASGQSDK